MCLICFAPEARSGLSKLVLAAYFDFCFYFRSVLREVPIPGGTDCTASLKCAAGSGTGSFLKVYANLSIVRSPIAAATPLKGRQAEFFKYQSTRSEPRRISSSRGTATLHLHPMSANPPPRRRDRREAPRGRSGTPGSSDFLVTFCSHKK